MKVNFGLKFFDMKKTILTAGPGVPAHLGEAAANALTLANENDRDFAGKAKKWRLAMKVIDGGEVEVTPEEVVAIKDAMGAIYTPLICGQAEDALNATSV